MDELVLHHYADLAVLGEGAPGPRHEGHALALGDGAGDAAQARRRRPDRRLPAHALHADRRRHLLRLGADVPGDRPHRARAAALSRNPPRGLAAIVAQWADQSFFWTAVPFTMQPAGVAHHLRRHAARGAEGLRRRPRGDVAGVAARAAARRRRRSFHDYLGRLEHLLADGRPFLLGALPSIADFSAAQSIWFMRRAPPVAAHARRLSGASTVWYERVAAFGHGDVRDDDERRGDRRWRADGIVRALRRRRRRPAFAAGDRRSTSTPPTTRTTRSPAALVGLDADEVVVERVDARAGTRPRPLSRASGSSSRPSRRTLA